MRVRIQMNKSYSAQTLFPLDFWISPPLPFLSSSPDHSPPTPPPPPLPVLLLPPIPRHLFPSTLPYLDVSQVCVSQVPSPLNWLFLLGSVLGTSLTSSHNLQRDKQVFTLALTAQLKATDTNTTLTCLYSQPSLSYSTGRMEREALPVCHTVW